MYFFAKEGSTMFILQCQNCFLCSFKFLHWKFYALQTVAQSEFLSRDAIYKIRTDKKGQKIQHLVVCTWCNFSPKRV